MFAFLEREGENGDVLSQEKNNSRPISPDKLKLHLVDWVRFGVRVSFYFVQLINLQEYNFGAMLFKVGLLVLMVMKWAY